MQKGKLGFSVWLYPFLALWSVLMGNLVSTLLIVGFAIAVEKDEWCTKQCLHAVMFQIYWGVLDVVMSYFTALPLAGYVFAVIDFIIWLILLILVFIVGLGRLKRGEDIGLPGKGIVNRAYGMIQQYIVPQQYTQPVPQPYVQPVAQPYTQSVQQPVPQSASQPVQQTVSQSSIQPVHPSALQEVPQPEADTQALLSAGQVRQTPVDVTSKKIIAYNTMTGEPIYEE